MGDERRVKTWLQQSVQYLGAALTAAGVSIGSQIADGTRIAGLERQVAENAKVDESAHADCAHFRAVDLSGFSDPRVVYAIDQQVKRLLCEYESKEHASAWRKRLKQLNPAITILDE